MPDWSALCTEFGGYLQLGEDFNDYLGAEFRIGTAAKGTRNYVNGSVSRSADHLLSYLLKLQYPTTPPVVAIGSATKTGVSFGAGLDYMFADQLRGVVEWVRYTNDLTIDGYTATLKYLF